MMKIGFSSLACPNWDLPTIVSKTSEMGFDAVELRGLLGELHLPLAPELGGDPAGVRELFRAGNVELACLGTSATLDARRPKEVARQKATIIEFMELASRLGCPYVRLFAGEAQRRDNRRAALARVADALGSLTASAARLGVTLLVENGGDFPGSDDLWFLVDAVAHPAVQGCWNQCIARTVGERPTNSIPRLGGKIGLFHLCDGRFNEHGVLTEYTQLGLGDVEIARQIELLKGMMYEGLLLFEWPRLWVPSLAPPETALPEAARYLRERLEDKQVVLSAYKGDKHAPRLARPQGATSPT